MIGIYIYIEDGHFILVRALIDFLMMFRSKKKLVEKIMELGLCHDRSKLGRVSKPLIICTVKH
jgi:hypothetical protein